MRRRSFEARGGWWLAAGLALSSMAACIGTIGGDVDDEPAMSQEALAQIGESGARRLTAAEYDATVADLLGVTTDSELALPEDLRTPFDNDYTKQIASAALISAAESLAAEVADEVTSSPTLREAITPCEPSGPGDEACYRELVITFGRRAFRRPLTSEEVDGFSGLFEHAAIGDDFWVAVNSALRAFLQHPSFLYRLELGQPVEGEPDVVRLTDYELATRLSYTLIGSTPPEWLLDEAEAGKLATAEGVRSVTRELLEEERALDTLARFHAMWLGYEKIGVSADLAEAMQQETKALLERVILDDRAPWKSLLTAEETFVTPELASHYELPSAPEGQADWVSYEHSGRKGLLSHGSFLSAVAKFGGTSPTQRGLLVRTRLFCQEIHPPPPDLMVDVDNPPEADDPNACKLDTYDMWQRDGCSGCHILLEPVGFGLERYDATGRYREHEPDRPDCPIDGQGSLEGIGAFSGPGELGELLVDAGGIEECVATQLYRYATGRYELHDEDESFVEHLMQQTGGEEGLHFDELVIELLSSESFRHRREEKEDS